MPKKAPQDRILAVDTMRGTAMFLIIFAHSRALLNQPVLAPMTWMVLYYCTNISTVAFTFVNGTLLSYFFSGSKPWLGVYWKFAKRALLLLACHPLIKVISYPAHADEGTFWHYFFTDYPITDTIALCLLITPWITRWVGPRKRIALIVGTLAVCPVIVGTAHGLTGWPDILMRFFIGTLTWSVPDVDFPFPLLPWLAIDLCGSLLGKSISEAHNGSLAPSRLLKRCRVAALYLLCTAAGLLAGYKIMRMRAGATLSADMFQAIYPSKTTGLLPLYVAILLLVFAWLFKVIDLDRRYHRAAWIAAVFGRTSLFTYNIEFITVMTVPTWMGLKGTLTVPQFLLAFVSGAAITWVLSYYYGRARGWIGPQDYQQIKNREQKKPEVFPLRASV